MRIAAVLVVLAAGCQLSSGDDAPECEGPNPGCPEHSCSPTCGDVTYRCTQDGWVADTVCDTCLGRTNPYPSEWTVIPELDPFTDCDSTSMPELLFDAQGPIDGVDYLTLIPRDPSIEVVSVTGQWNPRSANCLTDIVVRLRTADAEVRMDLAMAGLTNSITGAFDATIGICQKHGEVEGTFTLDGAP